MAKKIGLKQWKVMYELVNFLVVNAAQKLLLCQAFVSECGRPDSFFLAFAKVDVIKGRG